jgi:hypothetical protein
MRTCDPRRRMDPSILPRHRPLPPAYSGCRSPPSLHFAAAACCNGMEVAASPNPSLVGLGRWTLVQSMASKRKMGQGYKWTTSWTRNIWAPSSEKAQLARNVLDRPGESDARCAARTSRGRIVISAPPPLLKTLNLGSNRRRRLVWKAGSVALVRFSCFVRRKREDRSAAMAKRLIPSLNRVLVEKLVQPKKTPGGILLPETSKQVCRLLVVPFRSYLAAVAERPNRCWNDRSVSIIVVRRGVLRP